MPLNPDTVSDSQTNSGGESQRGRVRERVSERERERMAEQSITAIHPQSLNFYFLCLCNQPFGSRQRGEGGAGGWQRLRTLALACASICRAHIRAVISRGLWEGEVSLRSCWKDGVGAARSLIDGIDGARQLYVRKKVGGCRSFSHVLYAVVSNDRKYQWN